MIICNLKWLKKQSPSEQVTFMLVSDQQESSLGNIAMLQMSDNLNLSDKGMVQLMTL